MMALKTGLAGKYRLEVKRPDGSVRLDTGWFDNLITNNGLNAIAGTTSVLSYCQVGSGSTAPANTDTALVSKIAHTNTWSGAVHSHTTSSPYYAYWRGKYLFAAGAATGNIAEVGVGTSTSGGLFSRALITSGGTPTTITVLSDETLDVTYELRHYIPETDVTGSITLDSVSYNYTIRAARAGIHRDSGGWFVSESEVAKAQPFTYAYTGSIGAITSVPSGTYISGTTPSNTAYSNGTYYQDATFSWSTSYGNLSGGIGAVLFVIGGSVFQIGFSSPIPKDATNALSLTFRLAWARHT